MEPYEKQTVDWEELDKIKFYTYGFTLFMGVRALVYPPFVLKTKMQVERGGGASMSAIRVARETVRMEGIRGLYKGFWISSSTLVFRQFYFTAYEVIRHRLGPKSELYAYLGPETGEVVRNMVAGGASSITTQFFTVPVDIISQRMVVDGIQRGQAVSLARAAEGKAVVPKVKASGASALELEKARSTAAVTGGASEAEAIDARREGKSVVEARHHTTAREVARRVYSESGLRGFYRGFGVSILQFAPTSAIWWTAYGLYSKAFLRILGSFHPEQLPPLTAEQRQIGVQAAAGFCTGMTTVVLTNPLDVLRTRLQVAGRRGDGRTLLSEYRALMAESGPHGFLRGLLPRMLAMAPTSVLILSVYELIKRLSRKTPAPLQSPSPGAAVTSGEAYS